MLSNRTLVILLTALAPALWGTTYITASTVFEPGHPLLTATLRALPAGLILLAIARRRPRGAWWWKSVVLGTLNIAVFFGCLFVAADRLPGGVAAVIGGVQPLLVAVLGARFLGERINTLILGAGVAGVVGVGLIVLQAHAGLDALGVGAALGGAASMGVGTILAKRWAGSHAPIATTSWQLLAGGLVLAVATAVMEPLPTAVPGIAAILGHVYLAVVGTALAYVLWFRGIAILPTRIPAFLGLLSPIVALGIGLTVAGETLSLTQILGLVLVLASVAVAVVTSTRGSTPPGSRGASNTTGRRPAGAGVGARS
ncbi:EamA family transporter [Labedella endophytica]|uniref:EamA family transporter n=1 Tax=Labedella endophytica TaxID=1523160 RepID=A0A3S1CPX4_9MICO|nr:EamA family transporter [Labedella endophytica]RUQ98124.1 EamA family transporter [Labedella endophytica]